MSASFSSPKLTVSKCYNQSGRRPLSNSIARGLQLLGGAFRRSAASPAMLPRSSDLELVINFKTAKTIGVDVPTPLPCTSFAAVQCLLLADFVAKVCGYSSELLPRSLATVLTIRSLRSGDAGSNGTDTCHGLGKTCIGR